MKNIYYKSNVTWAQMDPNQHMRHSAYADYCAQARLVAMQSFGLSLAFFKEQMLGPILFREELNYLREAHLNDELSVSCELIRSRKDGSRWSIRHEIFRTDGTKVAVVQVDGAWLDLRTRKLAQLPEVVLEKFSNLPKSVDYEDLL